MNTSILPLLITVLLSFAPVIGLADTKYGSDLPIQPNNMIEIKSYDVDSRAYEILAVDFPGEGESYVTPEGLKKGVRSIDLKTILKKPQSIVGNQYKTDRNLPTLFDSEREARRHKFKK